MSNTKEILKIQKLLYLAGIIYIRIMDKVYGLDVPIAKFMCIMVVGTIIFQAYILNKRFTEAQKNSTESYKRTVCMYNKRVGEINEIIFAIMGISFSFIVFYY